VLVSWIIPPPVVLSPANGLVSVNPSLTVSGTGMPRASLEIFDAGIPVASNTVSTEGRFAVALKPGDGAHLFTAVQTYSNLSSLPGAAVSVQLVLAPVILFQPQSDTNFLTGKVTFTAAAMGAATLRYSWEKDGAKIPGASGPALAFPSITAADAGSYQLFVTNAFGATNTGYAVLTLVPNPFTNLTGNYHGFQRDHPQRPRRRQLQRRLFHPRLRPTRRLPRQGQTVSGA
jgi:hypothetical protein